MRIAFPAVSASAAFFVAISQAWGADSTDPNPPKVAILPPMAAAKAQSYDRVTFHGAPKPLPQGAVTHDWKTFLGPTYNGFSTETKLIRTFPANGPQVVWELETGDGYASPSIQGEHLVYVHRVRDEVVIECLHPRTGDRYWEHRYATSYADRYGYSNGPRASPVIAGQRVYLLGVEGELICLELPTGRVIWQRNINKDFDVVQDFFGTVGTPLLQGDNLIINVGGKNGPCVAAFHKLTGKLVWTAGKNKWGPSYASPIPAVLHGQQRVLVFAGGDSEPAVGGLLSLHPATGKVDFEFPWRSSKYESVNASCPVAIGNQIFISATYRAGSALLNVNPDFTQTVEWTMRDREHNTDDDQLGIHWNTPIVKDGHLYAFDGRNEPDASLVCVNVKTGKVVWREEPEWEETLVLNGQEQKLTLSTLRGNLLHVDGRFLCQGELGHLMWLDLSPQGYREISRCRPFLARYTWALPVISQGLVYISQNSSDVIARTGSRLICYDFRAAQ
ncbi:MAG: PQQ-binding-like beta-propeller repeat protein [Planctomycetota bacterium]|nr:PQQ-binding-like beta-propeller repeat protein [Planctomycetota bacterium]